MRYRSYDVNRSIQRGSLKKDLYYRPGLPRRSDVSRTELSITRPSHRPAVSISGRRPARSPCSRKIPTTGKTFQVAPDQICSLSDQPRLDAIVDLISNASPAADPQTRSNLHRRSLKLWINILCSLRDNDEAVLKQSFRSCPTAVRARFDHARIHHERNSRWWRTDPLSLGSPGFKRSSPQEIRDLSAVNSLDKLKSGI
jgi:hypothetical protein